MNKKVFLYLQNLKGLKCLLSTIDTYGHEIISGVQYDTDTHVLNDYSDDIVSILKKYKIPYSHRKDHVIGPGAEDLSIAIGWRRLIENHSNLIIFHDSLLPRLRGFNPLVTALMNKDPEIGATALWASQAYDQGTIVNQASVKIDYPITIFEATEKIADLYVKIMTPIIRDYLQGNAPIGNIQNESRATYSIWRDDDDYTINWNDSAQNISHLINCLGEPYLGAKATYMEKTVRIHSARIVPDVVIENRCPGKIFSLNQNRPIVICGTGMIELVEIRDNERQSVAIKLLRTRFS